MKCKAAKDAGGIKHPVLPLAGEGIPTDDVRTLKFLHPRDLLEPEQDRVHVPILRGPQQPFIKTHGFLRCHQQDKNNDRDEREEDQHAGDRGGHEPVIFDPADALFVGGIKREGEHGAPENGVQEGRKDVQDVAENIKEQGDEKKRDQLVALHGGIISQTASDATSIAVRRVLVADML